VADILILREKDVREVLDYDTAIDAVEEGYRQYGLGLVQSPPWRELSFKGRGIPHGASPGIVQAMAYLEKREIAVIKHFYLFRNSKTSTIYLIDAKREKILAIMEANYESWMRTGAAGAVAAKYLARNSSSTLGMIGTGNQARAQTSFVAQVLPIKQVLAYSIDPVDRRQDFVREMEKDLKIEVRLVANPKEAVENAEIVVTATPSTQPIVEGDWLEEGLHITSIGADDPQKVELAASALIRTDKLVIDYEKALETAQLQIPLSNGVLKQDDIYATIGEVVAGLKPGREDDTEITIFHSTGMTAQDVTLALAIYHKARDAGIGFEVDDALRIMAGIQLFHPQK
jgi:alanine dehydrogenase